MNQGRIEQVDKPAIIYNNPVNRFVADFIGKINMMEAHFKAVSEMLLQLQISGLGEVVVPSKEGIKSGDQGVLAIRPEQIQIHPASDIPAKLPCSFRGKIHDFLYGGDVTTYIIELENGIQVEALLSNSMPERAHLYEINDLVMVDWQEHAAHFFPDRS